MTTEEKARAYDKAIEKIKYVMEHGVQPVLNKEDLQDIFPELAESKDERISREITEFILTHRIDEPNDIEDTNSWLVWLEKKGEQKFNCNEDDIRIKDRLISIIKEIKKQPLTTLEDWDGYIAWLEKQGQVKDSDISQHENKTCKENDDSLTCEDERIRKAIIDTLKDYHHFGSTNGVLKENMIAWLEKQGEKPTIPKWKYKKDHTPLLRDSLILNKYGCVAKSPSGAVVSDVWVIDYDELAKLPKEEFEKQDEKKEINPTLQEKERMDDAFTKMMLKPQVDGFDAELNALLKKYEYLPKEEVAECLSFYLGVVKDNLNVVIRENPTKHEGWVNIYKHEDGYTLSSEMLNTVEEARKYWNKNTVATIKIYWEE